MKAITPATDKAGQSYFNTTHWSVVLAAGQASSPEARVALEELCRTYWYPLYAYLRRSGHATHEAQDLAQGFFAHILQRESISKVERIEGMKFRSWLLGVLRNFVTSEWRKGQAQSRGGGQTVLSIDAGEAEGRYHHEPVDPRDPEKLFERKWAITLLARVLFRLEERYAAKGRQALFNALQPFVQGGDDPASHQEIARSLGMKPGTVGVYVCRLREQYQELLRAEIANTVASRAEIEEELNHLRQAISQ